MNSNAHISDFYPGQKGYTIRPGDLRYTQVMVLEHITCKAHQNCTAHTKLNVTPTYVQTQHLEQWEVKLEDIYIDNPLILPEDLRRRLDKTPLFRVSYDAQD